MKKIQLVFALAALTLNAGAKTASSWWPEQKRPASIIVCNDARGVRDLNLAASVSGLAAQALNEGTGTEGVWIESNTADYTEYFQHLLGRLNLTKQPQYMDVWKMVQHFKDNGTVKGYILYDLAWDASINIATTRAALTKGVLIEKAYEKKAQKLGLKCLFDATDSTFTEEQNFKEIGYLLSNKQLCLLNPKLPNNRDFAIAHYSMVTYGVNSFLEEVLEWVEPLSPVIGWNSGPESYHIMPCTQWGLMNTVSDFCQNLPMLSCDQENADIATYAGCNPAKINYKDKGIIYHSFVMSDGDNMQWTMGNYMHNESYWGSPYATDLAMSYTNCTANLAMGAPDALACLVASQKKNTGVIEYGGGYYYPDKFACKRSNREEILRGLARTLEITMSETGVSVLGFICMDIYSEGAREAYKIFAEEIPNLTGMVALQYNPYNKGNGEVIWVKNRKGINIPVCTAKYQVWANLLKPGSDDPKSICELINDSVPEGETKAFNWTIIHAWSRFEQLSDGSLGDIPNKENGGQRGVIPIKWGAESLSKNVRLVPIDEMLWRLRMYYYPKETNQIISKLKK